MTIYKYIHIHVHGIHINFIYNFLHLSMMFYVHFVSIIAHIYKYEKAPEYYITIKLKTQNH